jgi:exonuclease SbcD
MGHIHKPQDVNEGQQPPVIYPGSIERVDFGEAKEDRFFVIAQIEKGRDTEVEWKKLTGVRPFIERRTTLQSSENVTEFLISVLPKSKDMDGAVVKLVVEYPREWDTLIDESALRKHAELAFEFHLVKRPQVEARVRLEDGQFASSVSPLDLLDQYWRATKVEDAESLQKLAQEILSEEHDDLQ